MDKPDQHAKSPGAETGDHANGEREEQHQR
jgi:hypothetical protein